MPLLSRPVATQASSTPNTGSSSSNSQGSSQEQIARQQYLSPFSAVDPSVQEASSSKSSQQQDPAENDKWGDVLSVNHTLSSLYIKNFQVSAVPEHIQVSIQHAHAQSSEDNSMQSLHFPHLNGSGPQLVACWQQPQPISHVVMSLPTFYHSFLCLLCRVSR